MSVLTVSDRFAVPGVGPGMYPWLVILPASHCAAALATVTCGNVADPGEAAPAGPLGGTAKAARNVAAKTTVPVKSRRMVCMVLTSRTRARKLPRARGHRAP